MNKSYFTWGLGNDSLDMTPNGQATKKLKNKKVGLHQSKKHLHTKRNY